jgi:hypothetical protein
MLLRIKFLIFSKTPKFTIIIRFIFFLFQYFVSPHLTNSYLSPLFSLASHCYALCTTIRTSSRSWDKPNVRAFSCLWMFEWRRYDMELMMRVWNMRIVKRVSGLYRKLFTHITVGLIPSLIKYCGTEIRMNDLFGTQQKVWSNVTQFICDKFLGMDRHIYWESVRFERSWEYLYTT